VRNSNKKAILIIYSFPHTKVERDYVSNRKTENLFKLCIIFSHLNNLALIILFVFLLFVPLFDIASVYGSLEFIVSFFILSFSISTIHSAAAVKLSGLKRKPTLLVTKMGIISLLKAISFFILYLFTFFIIGLEMDLSSKMILVTVFATCVWLLYLFILQPIIYKRITNMFNKIERRRDLERRFSDKISKLKTKVKILQIKEPFFNSISAVAILQTNEIILLGDIEKILTKRELDAIILHELAHLKGRNKFLLKRVVSGLIALSIMPFLLFSYYIPPIVLFSVMLFAPVVLIFTAKTVRAFEKEADEIAKKWVGSETYLNALKKLYEYNKVPAFGKLSFLIPHPDKPERLKD